MLCPLHKSLLHINLPISLCGKPLFLQTFFHSTNLTCKILVTDELHLLHLTDRTLAESVEGLWKAFILKPPKMQDAHKIVSTKELDPGRQNGVSSVLVSCSIPFCFDVFIICIKDNFTLKEVKAMVKLEKKRHHCFQFTLFLEGIFLSFSLGTLISQFITKNQELKLIHSSQELYMTELKHRKTSQSFLVNKTGGHPLPRHSRGSETIAFFFRTQVSPISTF